jgi:flagella basal body P-ring formation protein FlgA
VHLTVLGKALESGTEGDVVNVMNLQSKRTVSAVVVGRGRVAIVVAPRPEVAQQAVQPKLQDKLQDKVSDSTSSLGAAPAAAAASLASAGAKVPAKPE